MGAPAQDDVPHESLQHWIDAELFDPTADTTGERREVLEWLDGIGLSPAAFDGVLAPDLPAAINRRVMQPGKRVTTAEASDLVDLDTDTFGVVCRAAGYPADHLFTDDDIEALQLFAAAKGFFTDEEFLHFVRVLSASMGRVAEAATALFRIDISPSLENAESREIDWAKTNHESIQLIEPLLVAARSFLLRELAMSSVRSDQARTLIGDTGNTSTLRLAVGFVDLVGYTSMAEAMNEDDLGRFIRNFEARSHDVVTAHGGRVVKLIGDEVMFVTLDPADACATALALIDAFDDDDATPRGGIASGDVVARGGDYYGSVVNLAARIAALAVTGEVLVDNATAERAAESTERSLIVEPAGRRMLKGFSEPIPLLSVTDGAGAQTR